MPLKFIMCNLKIILVLLAFAAVFLTVCSLTAGFRLILPFASLVAGGVIVIVILMFATWWTKTCKLRG